MMNTFDFIVLDCGAAVGRLFDVGALAGLLVDDAPACFCAETIEYKRRRHVL